MKRIILAASALTLLATPALAQTSQVNLDATVTKACGFNDYHSGNQAFATQATLNIVNPTTGAFAAASTPALQLQSGTIDANVLGFGNFWCNGPSTVTLSASPLQTNGGAQPTDHQSFASRFDLEVRTGAAVYMGGTEASVYTTAGKTAGADIATGTNAGAIESGTGRYSRVAISVLPNGTRRPVAGDYTGWVRLTVGPN